MGPGSRAKRPSAAALPLAAAARAASQTPAGSSTAGGRCSDAQGLCLLCRPWPGRAGVEEGSEASTDERGDAEAQRNVQAIILIRAPHSSSRPHCYSSTWNACRPNGSAAASHLSRGRTASRDPIRAACRPRARTALSTVWSPAARPLPSDVCRRLALETAPSATDEHVQMRCDGDMAPGWSVVAAVGASRGESRLFATRPTTTTAEVVSCAAAGRSKQPCPHHPHPHPHTSCTRSGPGIAFRRSAASISHYLSPDVPALARQDDDVRVVCPARSLPSPPPRMGRTRQAGGERDLTCT